MKIVSPTLRSIICFGLLFVGVCSVKAQSDGDAAAKDIIVKALTLYQQGRYTEAVPYMQMLVEAAPDTPEIRFAYGVCLLGKSKQIQNPDEAKKLSAQALEQLLKAKELGYKNVENESLINLLSGKAAASSDNAAYSSNKDADKAMVEAENLFAQSKYDEAIKKYEKVLSLDPKVYRAALGGGDSYTAKGDWEKAEKWYERGISIDPNRETAYRYSATPLMKQEKFDLARDRYIEALITEPYSSLSKRGIGQWAQITGAKLGHPAIPIPEVSFNGKGDAITRSAYDANDPASKPWLAYLATRELWKKEKFAKTFPKEHYRHSLQEEAEALRAAIASATELKSTSPQMLLLRKMDADGVLEAFIIMAIADDGIAADHPEFLKDHRPELRKYVASYVISK